MHLARVQAWDHFDLAGALEHAWQRPARVLDVAGTDDAIRRPGVNNRALERVRPVADNNRDPHAIDLVEASFDGFHPLETVVAMNTISDPRNRYRVSFIEDLVAKDQA